MTSAPETDVLIAGGGFYGCRLAIMLRRAGRRVMLVEREGTLLGRASLRNQARVHNGYHYPRSILTSLRSRLNYARFLDEYGACVDRSFPHYYAIARHTSKVTGNQFAEFCRRIGAPLTVAPEPVKRLFDKSRTEAVFEVQECAFDAVQLRAQVSRDIVEAEVDVRLATEVRRIRSGSGGAVVTIHDAGVDREVQAELVLNCTYSGLNSVLRDSGAATIPARHEVTELALVHPPAQLAGAAVTVMDGPFFSLMPYPSRGLFTLSHVRYTPHCTWQDELSEAVVRGDELLRDRQSHFEHMVRDAQRYLPLMQATRYVDSLFEIKTIMPRSEQDDSRPILLRRCAEHPSMITVLGAKIDSVFDVEEALRAELDVRTTASPLMESVA